MHLNKMIILYCDHSNKNYCGVLFCWYDSHLILCNLTDKQQQQNDAYTKQSIAQVSNLCRETYI